MINHLRGTVHRLDPTDVTIDVQGVGYKVAVPLDIWETLEEGTTAMLWISSYIREDRFDLFGFSDRAGKTLFEAFIAMAGIGPKLGLELCSVPREILVRAIEENDPSELTNIKGIGKKTAEKLLLELKSLRERKPSILVTGSAGRARHEFDQDAVAALSSLGYDTSTIVQALKSLPKELGSTEERVAAALRAL